MPKIQTSCPQCQQPLVAEIFQVIDARQEPRLKELLLAGGLNMARCQICGFQGQLPIPVVYHDAEKELLLTFTPPDPNKTMEEKEGYLAPLLKKVIDNLKPEERKGYLFQPQAMLTMNNLVKNVLMGDGITEEMIQAQQEKIALLDKLFAREGEQLTQIVKENNAKIDREFFAIFAEIAQRILSSQDEKAIGKIQQIQDALTKESDIGKEILSESQEYQAARQALEKQGQNLTRASLLELVVNAPNKHRLQALVSLVRPAMDYEFFQIFTERIEKSEGETRNDLVEKRNYLLKLTQELDKQVEARMTAARQLVNSIIESDNQQEALLENLNAVDQFFLQAASLELEQAEKSKQEERKTKLENLMQSIQELVTPEELKVLDKLLADVEDESSLASSVAEIGEELSSQLITYLTSLIAQYEERLGSSTDDERADLEQSLEQIKKVYNAVLKHSMKAKFSAEK